MLSKKNKQVPQFNQYLTLFNENLLKWYQTETFQYEWLIEAVQRPLTESSERPNIASQNNFPMV